ncbi:Ig-like domain-containing protein, partial [Verminephrobacter aporrectodeae]
ETTIVTFTFNKPVNGFDARDIGCTNGTLSAPTANAERTVWTATLTPTANVNAPSNTIHADLTGVTDDAGKAGEGEATSANYSVDTRPAAGAAPQVDSSELDAEITLADSALTVGETTTVTFTFNKPVNGFDARDISCRNGTLSAPTANAERTVWTATLTPTANVNAPSNAIHADLTGVTDDAGKAGEWEVSSANYSVDTRPAAGAAPQVDSRELDAEITLADSALTVGETTTVTVTFNKPVNGFDARDIACTNGTLSLPTANADRTVWTATLTPTANVNAPTNVIHADLTGVTDDAGNAGEWEVSSANYSVDTRPAAGAAPPVDSSELDAEITLADSALTAGETTTVTFTFNKPVNGFDARDISCRNGTLSAPTANAERTVWTATLTPTANVSAPTNVIHADLTGVTDDAGNAGEWEVSSANYSVDTRPAAGAAPQVDSRELDAEITLADSVLTVGETTTVTFTFNKPVNGFDARDIACTNGTLSLPTANADRTVWTATLTPTANVSAPTNTIHADLAGVTDDAGKAGEWEVSSANYSVDTRPAADAAPQVDSRELDAEITLADSALTVGETTTVTFTFNKPVNGFDARDIGCRNGTLSAPVANAERTVWTATLTPTANVNAPSNVIHADLTGVTDDAGNAGEWEVSSANYSVDTRPAADASAPRSFRASDADNGAASPAQETQEENQATEAATGDGTQEDRVQAAGSNTRITSLEHKEAPAQLSRALETPIALTGFKATLDTAGSSETFSLYADPKSGANGYWVQDGTGALVNLASALYGGKVVHEDGRSRLDFAIKDGGQFDADGQADGVITAFGAAAQMPLSITGQASDGLREGFWF